LIRLILDFLFLALISLAVFNICNWDFYFSPDQMGLPFQIWPAVLALLGAMGFA